MDYARFMLNTKRKVVLAFLLAISAILVALVVSYLGFNRMLTVVDDLAAPNEKLKLLHQLYQRVTEMDHKQRLEAIQNPWKPDQDFLKESHSLLGMVSELKSMPWSTDLQAKRIHEIERILHHRDSLFVKYLQLKSNALRNKKLSKKFDTLATLLAKNTVLTDTSIRTTQKKKTTVNYNKDSVIYPEEPKRSFFSRLFKKKATPVIQSQPKEKVTEEVMVTVDTLFLEQRNNSIAEASKLIRELGTTELIRRRSLAYRELAFLQTSHLLFSQMMDIVHQVEVEEILQVRKNNEVATLLFSESVRKMMIILVVFCLLAAVLVYLILIDISRSNYYKARLTEEKDRAEELGRVKQRFLDNMSHEMRTPLQSILGFSEQLLRQPAVETKSAVQAIHSSSEHLLHVVNEVLDYSRLDSGKLIFENQCFYLLEVVEEVALAMKVQAEKQGLQFFFDAEESENVFVSGDPFRLRQILYNVLGNAVKFTSHGSVKLFFRTVLEERHVRAEITVADTGIGISEQEMDKIFQRFEQANPSIGTVYGGSGLGLTIVKMLVEALNGELRVASEVGKGSEFIIHLTYRKETEPTPGLPKAREAKTTAANVLVIDDDLSILHLCGMILKEAGIRYTLEHRPELLYDQALPEVYTHVLMDVRMGKVDGFHLAKALRKKGRPRIPIIAMSAMTQIDRDPAFHETFDALLLKPFHAEELLVMLDRFSAMIPKASYNPEAVKKLTLGDDGLLRSALSSFIRETESDIFRLEQSLKNKEAVEVKEILHKMKGRIGQFGYLSLSASLGEFETMLENKNSTREMDGEMNRLKEMVEQIIAETRQELVRLN
jgi:signal transduction histidine kinase/DNA-binding response OmpR family regulator